MLMTWSVVIGGVIATMTQSPLQSTCTYHYVVHIIRALAFTTQYRFDFASPLSQNLGKRQPILNQNFDDGHFEFNRLAIIFNRHNSLSNQKSRNPTSTIPLKLRTLRWVVYSKSIVA